MSREFICYFTSIGVGIVFGSSIGQEWPLSMFFIGVALMFGGLAALMRFDDRARLAERGDRGI